MLHDKTIFDTDPLLKMVPAQGTVYSIVKCFQPLAVTLSNSHLCSLFLCTV